MKKVMKTLTYLTPALVAALLAGCASGVRNPSGVPVTQMKADERGFVAGTGIESQDMVSVTDKMARSILGIPQIANAQRFDCDLSAMPTILRINAACLALDAFADAAPARQPDAE